MKKSCGQMNNYARNTDKEQKLMNKLVHRLLSLNFAKKSDKNFKEKLN